MGAEIVEYVAGSKGIILSSFACAVASCISKHSSVLNIFFKRKNNIFFPPCDIPIYPFHV